jgi:hypothetical protein
MTKENKNKHHHHNQRITMVCSWIYTGYRKQNSWIEQKKRQREYTRMRRKKREREKLLRACKTVKEKERRKKCFVFVLFNHDDRIVNKA